MQQTGWGPFIALLSFGLTITIGLTVNETHTTLNETSYVTETQSANGTSRRGRYIEEIIELPAPSNKIKRQIIKIPPSVSKVKLVQPPLNLRYNRAPQQFSRYPPIYRSGPWRPYSKKSLMDYDANDNSFLYDPKKIKRNLKKPFVKEMTPEEFYKDDEYEIDFEEGKSRPKKLQKPRQIQKVVKIKRKKPKQNVSDDYLANYEGEGQPNYEEGGVFDSLKIRYAGTEENQSFYGYDSAGSSIHMKQIPPPNFFPQNALKYSYPTDKSVGKFYEENYVPGLTVNKLPTKGRQMQSLFSQQYTTHNPHIATNFGLGEVLPPNSFQYGAKASFVQDFSHLGKLNQPVVAASNQVMTALPVNTPGIQVIQPPQFKDITVSHPSHPSRLMSSFSQQKEETSSQKATIKDILEQDCPSFDAKGYCDSPPRYPMHQIKSIVKKCSNLMEVMNTQPFEESQELYSFAKRSDNFEDRDNESASIDLGTRNQSSSWSRSGSDESTACISDLELVEPGYAKEANSGRWFVIVQHPDTTIQRIATDTCRNPGKFCGGLMELKCSKINNLPNKSTKCVQRHTYQRLISWDPESPDECPRMRVFRFPSACICHLAVV